MAVWADEGVCRARKRQCLLIAAVLNFKRLAAVFCLLNVVKNTLRLTIKAIFSKIYRLFNHVDNKELKRVKINFA
ncbi:MAG: hypothetical protein ABIJ45_09020 [Candidatus Zixiibacteriota bacterium]